MKRCKLALVAILMGVAGLAGATETTGVQAEKATGNWIRRHQAPLSARLSPQIGESRTVRNGAGRALFHAVALKGGGFVVTSGDTKVSPIIAFSDSGSFDDSSRNPLFVLIREQFGRAVEEIDAAATNPAPVTTMGARVRGSTAGGTSAAEEEWDELLDDTALYKTLSSSDTDSGFISDMRVDPLCPTQWSQQGWNGYGYAFNYYTPNHYPSGCTATALAQVMYRWRKPSKSMSAQTFVCTVSGTGYYISTKGGTYDWETMPQSMVTQPYATATEREAVGHFLYDVGVALKSEYTSSGTSSYGFFVPGTLKDYFGYAEAKCYFAALTYGSDVSSRAAVENGVYASLDAGMPVMLSIHRPLDGTTSGHCVVLDGYGYVDSARWTHLNSGWAGKSDAWYRFFAEPLTDKEYTYLQEYVYNIDPSVSGDVISGRVLDHTGKAVAGATVTCKTGSTTKTATTNARGIYSFRVTSSATYTLKASVESGLASSDRSVSVSIGSTSTFSTYFSSGWTVYNAKSGSVGNRWGIDLTLAEPTPESLVIVGASTIRSGESSQYEADVTYSDKSVKRVSTSSTWSLAKTAADSTLSSVGLLSVGTTYESGLSVTVKAEYGTLSATKDVTIIPLVKARKLSYLSISGKSSLEGGESSGYVATAHFDDGSSAVETTDSDWTIESGATYGTVGPRTGYLTTYETTEKGRVITLKASYAYGGATETATKDVAIAFTASLRRPASLTVEGSSRVTAGTTAPYVARVTYNDGTTNTVTLAAAWSLSSGATYGKIATDATSSRAVLTAYGASETHTVTLLAEYTEDATKVSGSKVVEIVPEVTIPEAVDVVKGTTKIYDLEFTTGSTLAGGNTWFGQTTQSHFDGDAAQSGFMSGSYGQNWLQTTVSGAGTFTFWWNVSSEETFDHLKFEIDGIERARISGTTNDWRQLSFDLAAGTHTLRWTYVKDEINDVGQDAGWVDKVTWEAVAAPLAPVVTATDGELSDAVRVSWTLPAGSVEASKYELSRQLKSGGAWTTLLSSTLDTAYLDKTAVAGRDYTYRVRASGLAGWGDYGSDAGWRKIDLKVTPATIVAAYNATETFVSAVTTEVAWVAATDDSWVTFKAGAGTGNGEVKLTVDACDSADGRMGSVTVTAGADTDHPAEAAIVVTQAGRPAQNDIAFFRPAIEWRTKMQVSPSADGTYNPTSVFTTAEADAGGYTLSFGWTNRGEKAVSLPSVRFRAMKPDRSIVLEWTEAGRPAETLSPGVGASSVNWPCDVVCVLDPGDYEIEAELDPADTLSDSDRSNNTAIFRFAIRDPALDAERDVLADEAFTNLALTAGNDFAQAPHAAYRAVTNEAERAMVQFGPYVPMNGVSVTGGKGALDIVFLIDLTGSMGGCISGLKANIKSFFSSLITGEDAVKDWRAKVVGYRDITCDGSWYEDYGFTTDVGALNGHIAACYASGGGDGPESLLDALCRISSESDFREGAARVIVAFTDAPEKHPMSYGDFKGKDSGTSVSVTQAELNSKEIALWVVASSYGYTSGQLDDLCDEDVLANSACIHVPSLSSFTGDAAKLKELAGSIGKIVPSTVVEPMMSVATRGLGTLSFKWCNDSTAGTNNVFTFRYDDGSDTTNCAAGTGWHDVTLDLTEPGHEGWHLFNWSYGKTGYDGAVTDCGLVSDIVWEPVGTHLELDPDKVFFTYDGLDKSTTPRSTGAKVAVTCNSVWKSTTEADWLHLVHGSGDGDGELYFEADTNTAYTARSATITVRAGEYGLATDEIVEKTIYVVQDESPVLPNGEIQILSVDVKPRWPWNDWVDIDFRLVPPAEGTEVKVYFSATNVEGAVCRSDFAYINGSKKSYCEPKANASSYFTGNEVTAGQTYAVCKTSGTYRVSWQMDGGKHCWDESSSYCNWNGGFHSPEVIVVVRGEASGKSSAALASDPARIDLRQTRGSGGLVMSGVERVGHPRGLKDPVWVDTTKLPNGWNALPVFDDLTDVEKTNLIACVINDGDVEGGTITNETVWTADRIHVVRDNVFIAKDATLTIEDGAIVKFCQSAHIFMYTDSTKAGEVGFSNLRMKGVYCTGGYDNYYGADILRAGEMTPSKAARGGGWDGSDKIIFSSGTAVADCQMVVDGKSTSTTKAVKKFLFYCPSFNDDGSLKTSESVTESNSYVTRYYTKGETWGKLPKPCEAGQEFYGWFKESVTVNFMESGKLSNSKYTANGSKYTLDPSTKPWSLSTTYTIYGLMVKADYFTDNIWPKDEVDVGATIVTLDPESAVYNGSEQKPAVTSVLVSGVKIPAANYEVSYGSGNYIDAGEYDVGIAFKHDYTGTPTAKYTINPCPIDGARVAFYYDEAHSDMHYPTAGEDTDGVCYLDTGVPKPKVRVYDGERVVPEADYAVTWHDAGWPAIGSYTVEIAFNGNYVGTAKGTFAIGENPDYHVVWYGSKSAVATQVESWKRKDGTPRRVLYLCGRDSDIPSRLVKHYIESDATVYNFVIDNFVCWYDDCDAAGSSFPTYSRGMGSVTMPLLAVVSPNNWSACIARTCGLTTPAALKAFLEAAAVAAEDASDAVVNLSGSAFTHDGAEHRPSVTVTYGGKTMPGDNYDVTYAPSPCVDVGAYAVTVDFKGTYLGYAVTGRTAAVSFEIVTRPIDDGDVTLTPAGATYDGREQRPSVSVTDVPSTDYDVSYGEGGYVDAGTYAVTIVFKGSRSGTVTRAFTISPRAVTAASVELSAYSAACDGAEHRPTVTRVFDTATEFAPGTDYTLDFGDGNYTTAGVYTVAADFKGNYSGRATAKFEIVDDTAEEDLPELDEDATELTDEIREALREFADPNVAARITTPALYRLFREWALSVGLEAAKKSSRAYESFRISQILNVPQLFDAEVLTLTLVEGSGGLVSDGKFCVSVSLKDVSVKGSEVQFQLKAAKEAFTEFVRLTDEVGKFTTDPCTVDADDVEAGMDSDGKSVVLSVTCPDGTAGFLKLMVE